MNANTRVKHKYSGKLGTVFWAGTSIVRVQWDDGILLMCAVKDLDTQEAGK